MSETRYPVEQLDSYEDDGTMSSNVAALAEAVVGHRIVFADHRDDLPQASDTRWDRYGGDVGLLLTLDNGYQVAVANSSDCCAYTTLANFLLHPERVDHIITGVGTTDGYTRWHIFADFGDVLEMEVDWSAGNPFYYGYGFDIDVIPPSEPPTREVGGSS